MQKGFLVHDPQEDDPRLLPLIKAAAEEARQRLEQQDAGKPWWLVQQYRMGYCHLIWREQKRILQEKHGLDWKSPPELNPGTRFD